MKAILLCNGLLLTALLLAPGASADDEARIAELDAYWAEVSRCVQEGDFEGYTATCHPDGTLVSGLKPACHPLRVALANWKQGFADTKNGKMTASVEFRFAQRLGDERTAHETGIFHYATSTPGGKATSEYIHFEGLLVKRDGWKIMMEYQKAKATKAEWDALK